MRVGSICSGAGIHLHGWSVPVWAIECDREIAQCYKDNHGNNVIVDCVENIAPSELKLVDCILATPSCKNASIANNKKSETQQDFDIAIAVTNILESRQPKYFLLENVVGYQNFTSFDIIITALQNLGYYWQIHKLNLANFGIAQSRRRMYLIASKHPIPIIIFPQYSAIGWYEAIQDLIPSLPDSFITNWQQRLIDKWDDYPNIYAVKRIGANCKALRSLLPYEPMYTWRAFGRNCGNHWQQVNIVVNGTTKIITPKAALRFFGDKQTADKIILPSNNAIASECVGNGASWVIFDWLIKNL